MQTVPGKGTKVGVRGFGRVTLGTILTKYMHFDALNNFCMSTKAQRAFVGEIDAMNCILLTYVPMDLFSTTECAKQMGIGAKKF